MPPLPRIRSFCAFLLLAPVLTGGLLAEPSDSLWDKYLSDHPLKLEECLAHAPSDLFHIIAARDQVSLYGSPSRDATMIDAFYAQYTRELSAYNDKHFSERVTSRPALRDLFYFVVEGLRNGYGERSYIDRERIDAYVEHIIASTPEKGFLPGAKEPELSAYQAANHARERLAKVTPVENFSAINPDVYRNGVVTRIQAAAKTGTIKEANLTYLVARLSDNHQSPLEPKLGPPEEP